MWSQETCRVLKSQQIRKSLICMCCSKATCSPSNHQNGFMANGGLGCISVHLCYTQTLHGCVQVSQVS